MTPYATLQRIVPLAERRCSESPLIIVSREVVEAGLIVGIVLAVTKGLAGSRLANCER